METRPPRPATGIWDCHMHLIGPEARFPFSRGHAGRFPPWAAADYRAFAAPLGITRAVVTQTPFYGTDPDNLLFSLQQLGPAAVGVAVVDDAVSQSDLVRLSDGGVVGANFYLMAGAELDERVLAPTNARIQAVGWQTQIQIDGTRLTALEADLRALKGTVVIDHIGKFQRPTAVDDPAFAALCRLLDTGRFYVKLSAPYESSRSAPPYLADVGALAGELIARYPDRLIWGSNWPHLGLARRADWPDGPMLLECLCDWGADARALQAILIDTPARLFARKPDSSYDAELKI